MPTAVLPYVPYVWEGGARQSAEPPEPEPEPESLTLDLNLHLMLMRTLKTWCHWARDAYAHPECPEPLI